MKSSYAIHILPVEFGGGAEGGGGGGTCGFPVNAHQYILEKHTSAGILDYDAEGLPHHLIGDQLSAADIIPFRGKIVHVVEEIFAGLR